MSSTAGRPLSLSLPFTGDVALKDDRVRNFFDNLLPDSETIRLQIATRFKTDSAEAFNLLKAIDRDRLGAVHLLGVEEAPTDVQSIMGTPFSKSEIEPCWFRPHAAALWATSKTKKTFGYLWPVPRKNRPPLAPAPMDSVS